MKDKSKASKKQKSKKSYVGGVITHQPLPRMLQPLPSQSMSTSSRLLQSRSQNPRQSLSISSSIISPPVRITETGNSSSHESPKATSNRSSPKATSNRSSPKATSNRSSPKATSNRSSPKVIANKDIIIKLPILSYDKVNQRHLLIDLDNCNSEYKSFEKNYYDNYKKIYTGRYGYHTRINTEYYQYGSSYLRFILFARNLLNTGDNLQQDDNVKAKKKELREMLYRFEAYLMNKRKDEIYVPELKITLDMTKEIVNKINTLYGSKLHQSYLRTITKIGENMKKVPSKLLEASHATVQATVQRIRGNTNQPDRVGIAIEGYQRRMEKKRMTTKDGKKKGGKKV